MMNAVEPNPRFSVILPTKGRPQLTRLVTESVLNQDYDNYEMIVVDNDDGDDTYREVEKFLDHPRFVYVRTGGLTMVDNWNRGLDEFKGDYLLWADSKTFFYPGAFTKLHAFLKQGNEDEVISWNYDFVFDSGKVTKYTLIQPGAISHRPAREVLEDFLKYRMKRHIWSQLPRGVCTAISKKTLADVRQAFPGEIFTMVSPDLILALKVLSVCSSVGYLGEPISCVASTRVSHGRSFAARKTDLSYFLGAKRKEIEEDLIVPIANRKLASNLIANDIEKTLNASPPIWQTYRLSYAKALAREIGTTIGRYGNVYEFRELRDVAKFWGFDVRPYAHGIARAVRCFVVTHFDALPSVFRKIALGLAGWRKSGGSAEAIIEVPMDAWEASYALMQKGRGSLK